MEIKAGDRVRMTQACKNELQKNDSKEHVKEFGHCVGVVGDLVDYGNQKGPEVDVYWQPSKLKYSYHPSMLEKV